jgi:thermostable 8-oxoguanine DNA glycosylase
MWELEKLFEKMGHRFAKKKADTIMFYANKDRNNCLDQNEFVSIYRNELKYY